MAYNRSLQEIESLVSPTQKLIDQLTEYTYILFLYLYPTSSARVKVLKS